MATAADNILLAFYTLLWVISFILYHYQNRHIDGGSAVMASYIVYCFFSFITLNDEFFDITYEHLRLFPFIYLYVMLMIALLPAIQLHRSPITEIEDPHSRALLIPCFVSILCIFAQIPSILSNFNSGFVNILTDSEAGKVAHLESVEDAESAGNAIRNLPAVLYNTLFDCSVFIFFFLLTRKDKNIIFLIFLFLAIIIGMIIPVMDGQRGSVIKCGLTIIAGYMLFRKFISKRIDRIIQIAGIIVTVIVAIPIIAITISRFSDRKDSPETSGYVYWYIGQANIYFNNYALDAGGTRNGDRTINLAKRLLSPDTPKNYTERREKYSNLNIGDDFFTTFVGDFAIDFGPLAAFIIFVVFNGWAILHIRPRDGTIKLHQLLLVYFALCVSLQGGMTLFMYSDTGNLALGAMIILYIWLRFHESLLKKFPKV
jgi:oligosaccharide repeat unit polymerase